MKSENIQKIYQRLQERSDNVLGYPLARDFSYSEFAPFLDICVNNVGDPENLSTLAIDTKDIEMECVNFFANMLSTSTKEAWGYVTNGGTEGNLYGLYVARESFPNAMVYYSESTHYSVKKNLHLLNIPNIVIRSQDNGEMDYEDLEQTIMLRRDKPAIFFLNIGTTMTEAIDKVDEIKRIIKKYAIKDYYIHCDAAFLGTVAPFLQPKPKFDFAEGVDSISVSGHKFIGGPIPCGIVLVKRKHRDRIANSISYVGTMDTTITGSRNGLTPLFIWSFIQKHGLEGLRKRVEMALDLAAYTEKELQKIGIKAWRNPNALTVVMPKLSEALRVKHQLASEETISHVICTPGISKEKIDRLLIDIKKEQEVNNPLLVA
ncbi:histidine decarboxylase [Zhouia amylolytica]|uniref:PLP-dependent enzyme, glutamate decarboxylase n=2 Tax=Zhouia amylolytica TaxID=376730 RepID=W2ULD6_9FLAO|nr:histidine decarboxylase [Zhouia amylolytica]ETN94818.1 PLP-dependent enzyme, glutamate decarboxylase [Zhouia amylolytica AD3]MCQ0110998.1 histidine decarboxylase [Zhouia amylolytica]SFS72505.1 histidine decarboxylase [Zhouia amylolytica]